MYGKIERAVIRIVFDRVSDHMNFTFERGSAQSPRGHALIYFHDSRDASELLATYMVILPIQVDVSKYVPPFLMNQIGEVGAKELSAFAFPPAPEPVRGMEYIENLAQSREDDIIYGGSINVSDVMSLMGMVNEAISWYSELWEQYAEPDAGIAESSGMDDEIGLSVNDVLYDLMSDQDKLNELTRLVGRLRDAAGSGDMSLAAETRGEIIALGRHLPDNHQVSRLANAAGSEGENSARLTSLYLQRCFHLTSEEYVMLGQVEEEIRSIEGPE